MRLKLKYLIYYSLLFFIGYAIYKFQLEKSFNLISVYLLTVIYSSFILLFKADSGKYQPILFLLCLFVMYGYKNEDGFFSFQFIPFLLLLSGFAIAIFVFVSSISYKKKKFFLVVFLSGIASIYFFTSDSFHELTFLPFVLGSFFMFRSISFLHELKYLKKPLPVADTINYFLLPPNFSMPLFPIVDYKSFINSYTGITPAALHRGTLLICRGVFQLILYRYIYHEIIIPFNEIETATQLITFLVANFLIVLRVIGAFHIAIGLIVLIGYNIPELFNNIFFATGFSNLWRRTNMYWRNFMIKIFYYPIYFKIKKIGIYTALFVSTFVCFFITWFLHTYQWFWLKGSFPVDLKDALFWGSFGFLVSFNTLYQQRSLDRSGTPNQLPLPAIRQAIAGLIVLLVMSVLWSIWTCGSLKDWWNLMHTISNITASGLVKLLMLALGYIGIASVYHYYELHKDFRLTHIKKNKDKFAIAGFVIFISTLIIINLVLPKQNRKLYRAHIYPILSEQLNRADLMVIDNGYYTNLISTNNYCSQVWINDSDIGRNWTKYITNHTTRPSNDLRLTENIPNAEVKFKDVTYTINEIGLRDVMYPKAKPDSCYRIIILGGSYECGNGMNDGEDYISLVEKELNKSYVATSGNSIKHIEIINFSVNGYRLMQRLYEYKFIAREWKPDAVLLFIHTHYSIRIVNYLERLVYQKFNIEDDYLNKVIKLRSIKNGDDGITIRDKLGSYADSINFYGAGSIAKIAKQDGAIPFVVYLPALKDTRTRRDDDFVATICHNDSVSLIDMSDVFKGMDETKLFLSDVDFHPNKTANEMIAKELLDKIVTQQSEFHLTLTKK